MVVTLLFSLSFSVVSTPGLSSLFLNWKGEKRSLLECNVVEKRNLLGAQVVIRSVRFLSIRKIRRKSVTCRLLQRRFDIEIDTWGGEEEEGGSTLRDTPASKGREQTVFLPFFATHRMGERRGVWIPLWQKRGEEPAEKGSPPSSQATSQSPDSIPTSNPPVIPRCFLPSFPLLSLFSPPM